MDIYVAMGTVTLNGSGETATRVEGVEKLLVWSSRLVGTAICIKRRCQIYENSGSKRGPHGLGLLEPDDATSGPLPENLRGLAGKCRIPHNCTAQLTRTRGGARLSSNGYRRDRQLLPKDVANNDLGKQRD